jgi:hypothetical protein
VANLPDYFNFGDSSQMTMEELLIQLQRLYTDLATAINQKPDLIQRTVNGVPTDGATTDTFLSNGTININTTTNKVEMLTNHTSPTAVVWTTLS